MSRINMEAREVEGKVDQLVKDVNENQEKIQIVSDCRQYEAVLVSAHEWEMILKKNLSQGDSKDLGYVEIVEIDWYDM